ncbi:MAG: hypothetical protein RIT45_2780 [Pseudomonadota bacterium]
MTQAGCRNSATSLRLGLVPFTHHVGGLYLPRAPPNDEGSSGTATYCEDGDWCQSGLCAYSGKHLKNVCYSANNWPYDHGCDVDQECANGKCVYGFLSGYYCN